MRNLANENVESKVIINAKVARGLLKLGYEVADIKPHSQIKYASVFVFLAEGDFEADKQRLIDEMKSKSIK